MTGEKDLRTHLAALGIGAGIVSLLFLAGMGFFAYKNWVEMQKLKLEVVKLKKELGVTSMEQVNEYWDN